MGMKCNKLTIYLPVFLIGIYINAIYLFDDLENMFAFANVLFVLMVFSSLYYGWRINPKLSTPRFSLLLYSAWVTLSIIWAFDKSATIDDIKRQIIFIVLWISVVNVLKFKNSYIESILKWIIVAGVCLTLFIMIYYGPLEYIQGLLEGKRMGADIVQLNKLGMYTASSCIVAFNFYLERKNNKYIILFFVPLIGMLGCGSKRAFLMLAVSLLVSALLKFGIQNPKNKAIKGIFLLLSICVTVFFISELEIFNGVLNRFQELFTLFEAKDADFSRFRFIKYGIESFLENPIFGLGSGNSHLVTLRAMGWATYLHNNYLEQLVNLGIIGFCVYYSIYFILLKRIISLAKRGALCSKIVAVLLISQLVSDIAVTSYNIKFTYILFAIAISVIENNSLEKEYKNEIFK